MNGARPRQRNVHLTLGSGEYRIGEVPRTESGTRLAIRPPANVTDTGAPPPVLRVPTPPAPFRRPRSQIDPALAVAAFAGFRDPPTKVWETPSYALHVFLRRRALAVQFRNAQREESPDLALYEAALHVADDAAFKQGIVVTLVPFILGFGSMIALLELW